MFQFQIILSIYQNRFPFLWGRGSSEHVLFEGMSTHVDEDMLSPLGKLTVMYELLNSVLLYLPVTMTSHICTVSFKIFLPYLT